MTKPSCIVVPCLNEEHLLRETCTSLGFGISAAATPRDCWLILVDNGSQDRTWEVMARICEHSKKDSVITVREPQRGYVPARTKGAATAEVLAATLSIEPSELLVLQADADTYYCDGYLSAMQSAAKDQNNFFLQGSSSAPPSFARSYPRFVHLTERVDIPTEKYRVPEDADVILSDNVSGYLLSDYLRWGGHVREFNSRGEEILAESSRLYIKAKLEGAILINAVDAMAHHSRRKLLSDPIFNFITSGFPREREWYVAWKTAYHGPTTLAEIEANDVGATMDQAIFTRQAHALILFGALPRYVNTLKSKASAAEPNFAALFALMNDLSIDQVVRNSATLFERAFDIIDRQPQVLGQLLRSS